MRGIRAIASRATYQRRREFYVPDVSPPQLDVPPVIDVPTTRHPFYNLTGFYAYEGSTIEATSGEWSDVDDTPTVVGRWIGLDGQPLAAEDEVSLTIPAGVFGAVWKEVATQGGTSTEYLSAPVEILDTPTAPWMQTLATITGDRTAGATLTKPMHVWYSPIAVTTAGEWWKNGVATGNTTSTYDDTVEGDILFWREVATDAADQSSTTAQSSWLEPTFLVGTSVETFAAAMEDEIDALIAGKTGGTTQDLWGSFNAAVSAGYNASVNGPPLDRNATFFAPSLVRQLTGVAAWKGPWEQYNCYTAITPRHVISCAHGSMGLCPVWFVHPTTGEIHKNNVIKQVNDYGLWNGVIKPSDAAKQTLEADVQVGLLESELPEWVMKYPVIPMTGEYIQQLVDQGNPPTLYVSQGNARPAQFPSAAYAWTPRGQKLCVSAVDHSDVTDPQRLLFRRYPLINGDSGCPEFILRNGTLCLFRTFTSSGGGGALIGAYVDYINGMIARVDASNGIDTGYTLNLATDPFSEDLEPFTATGSLIELADGSVLTRNI